MMHSTTWLSANFIKVFSKKHKKILKKYSGSMNFKREMLGNILQLVKYIFRTKRPKRVQYSEYKYL